MDKQKDFLPWIFGGLAMACVAVAFTLSPHKLASSTSPAPIQAAVPAVPMTAAVAPTPAAAPASAPAQTPVAITAPTVAVVTAQTVPAPLPPSGEVWECTTNGQRTYSDNPCGSKATRREISAVNIMSSASALAPVRSYGPDSSYAPDSNYAPDSYPSTQEYSDTPYPALIGVPYRDRPRPDHTHRPRPRGHVPPPRRS